MEKKREKKTQKDKDATRTQKSRQVLGKKSITCDLNSSVRELWC